jgi:NADH:ubiquinone oxidoreductase subunit E
MTMLTIYLCVGSSCYVRGSEQVAQTLQSAITAHNLQAEVEIVGTFCLENCSMGVTLKIGEQVFDGIRPEEAPAFFEREVLPRLDGMGGGQ